MANSYMIKIDALADQYKPGEDVNAFRERLKVQLDQEQPDMKKLDDLQDPSVKAFMITDEEVCRQRAQQSKTMRDKLVNVSTALVGRPARNIMQPICRAHRAVCNYYTSIGQPEKVEEFDRLFTAPEPDDVRLKAMQDSGMTAEQAQAELERQKDEIAYKRGKWLTDAIEPFRNMKPEECTNRSLEYASEHFSELYFVFSLAMNAEPTLKEGSTIAVKYTPEDRQRAQFMLDIYEPLGTCLSQAYALANPYFAFFDTERCMDELDNSLEKCLLLGVADSTNFGDMFTDLFGGVSAKQSGGICAVEGQLKNLGIDPKKAKYETMDGQKLDITSRETYDYISRGNTVCVTASENKKLSIRVWPPQKDSAWNAQINENLPELFNMGYTEALADLSKTVDDADPFYIRSSQQFRTMKHTLSELEKLGAMNIGSDSVSGAQQKAVADKIKELAENCRSYLDFKGTEGKNDLERRRIAAVQKVLSFAQNKTDMLDYAAKIQNDIAEAERAEEPMYEAQRAKKFLTQGLSYADLPAHGNAQLEEVNEGIRRAFDDERSKTYECIDPHKGAPTDKLEGEQLETAKNIVQLMTIKAILVNEQAAHAPNEPITNTFNKVTVEQFREFVSGLPEFQNVMNGMTREKMFKFVTEGGARTLAQDMVTAIAKKAHEKSHAPAQAQMEKNGPEVQKQSGPSM